MPDDFESDSEATADATAGDDEFGNPSDEFGNPSDEFSSDDDFVNSTTDYEMPSDDNPTPLEVPLTTTTQRPVRARREASPPVDDDSEPGVGRQGRGLPVWLRIVFSLIILAALLGLAFVVYRCVTDRTPLIPESSVQQPLPPLVVPTLPPLAPPPAAAPAETTPPPVATPATTPAATTPPPTSSQPAPAAGSAQRGDQPPTTPREPGVWYRLRWGDTLWDLSNAYYRNPWQYMKIFRANPGVIEHPDRIIATTWIYIPK
jgi:hypothetical protein